GGGREAGRGQVRVFARRPPNGRAWRGQGRLRPGPVKVMVEEGPSGLRPAPAALARRIALGATRGPVAVHCLGVSTLVAALDAFAALPHGARSRRRHRLEPLPEGPPPPIPRVEALGLPVVTHPALLPERGDGYPHEPPHEAS